MTSDGGMSGAAGVMSALDAKTKKQMFGAQVVKTTLDYMNSGSFGGSGQSADYDFQTKVLEAGAMLKGLKFNGKV